MRFSCRSLLFAVAVAVAGVVAAQAPAVLDYPALLHRLTALDWLWQPPPVGERCVQFSSFDRRCQAAGASQEAQHANRYANDDRGQYLRVESKNGVDEFVLVDSDGPGCIARIWSANPSGTLHFDIDGARVWSVDFAALCSGQLEGVGAPFAGVRARGANLYLPIPFQRHCRVCATAGDLYYHVDVVQFAAGTEVPSFTPAMLQQQRERLHATGDRLQSAAVDGRSSSRTLPVVLAANQCVRALGLTVERTAADVDLAEVLRRTRLVVQVGRDVLIDVPVTDFFGGGPDWRPWRGFALGVQEDGGAYCHLPMPFPRPGSLRLATEGDASGVRLGLSLGVSVLESMPDEVLCLRANYHQRRAIPTRPFSDHLVLDATGRGRFVGCSLLIRNPSRIWWGEGDEKFTVDGEAFPSWFGTGTEDYFGYAWCDPTPFQAPLHAQVQCDGPMTFGFTQLHRTHLLDSVPFQQSFRFDLEVWHWVEQIAVDYATVAYWYGAAGATSGLPPVPELQQRHLERLPAPAMFVAENALEGEALAVHECTGGTHEIQDLSFFEQTFSRDAHRWWRDGRVGDALVLLVPVAVAGRYRITAALTQADDFGIVQLSLAGAKLGTPFDGYAERVKTAGPREFGVVELVAGEAKLRIELVGRDPKAKERHMVGLDYLQLERVL